MAFRDIRRMMGEWYHMNVKPQVSNVRSYEYFRETALGVIGALVLIGAVWGYRHYSSSKETAAQIAFAESLQIFREAMQGKADIWPHVEMKCSTEYEKHKKSSLAPYFLVIKADALAQQGKVAEASETLAVVVLMLPKDSPLLPLYRTKRALMKIDLPSDADQAAGVEELRALASDKENKNCDIAQYYLGLYYWSLNDLAAAQTIWKELVASQASERLAASPWASLAQEKLATRGQVIEKVPITAPAQA